MSGEVVHSVFIIDLTCGTKIKKQDKTNASIRCCHLPVAMTFTLSQHFDQNVFGGVASDALQ